MSSRMVNVRNGRSADLGAGAVAVANISPRVTQGSVTMFDIPGTLSDPSRYPQVEIPVSTPERPYTPVAASIARWVMKQNSVDGGGIYDRGLRYWYVWWNGMKPGDSCPENDETMAAIQDIAAGKALTLAERNVIAKKNTPWRPKTRDERINKTMHIPDDTTTPEQLQQIVASNNLGSLITKNMPHATRLLIVKGALLDRVMQRQQVIVTPAGDSSAA